MWVLGERLASAARGGYEGDLAAASNALGAPTSRNGRSGGAAVLRIAHNGGGGGDGAAVNTLVVRTGAATGRLVAHAGGGGGGDGGDGAAAGTLVAHAGGGGAGAMKREAAERDRRRWEARLALGAQVP